MWDFETAMASVNSQSEAKYQLLCWKNCLEWCMSVTWKNLSIPTKNKIQCNYKIYTSINPHQSISHQTIKLKQAPSSSPNPNNTNLPLKKILFAEISRKKEEKRRESSSIYWKCPRRGLMKVTGYISKKANQTSNRPSIENLKATFHIQWISDD